MSAYEPVALSGLGTADAPERTITGAVQLRGLPFIVGDEKGRVVQLESRTDPVTVAIGRTARYVLIAHRLFGSEIATGGHPGVAVAEYTFLLADGTSIVAPIRDRFEVTEIPTGWGGLPFLAMPDNDNKMIARSEGNWSQAGFRQTEAGQGGPRDWYLYAWTNPSPDVAVESVRLASCGPRMVVGAMTTSDHDEYPFNRQARREVIVELHDDAAAGPIEVAVDRGWANYTHPLPADASAFEADPLKGWGEPNNPQWTPAVVEIGAQDSATVTVKHGDVEVASANWAELQAAGTVVTPRATLSLADNGRNWVHVKVLDEATGKPVPCRVHFRSPAGIAYQPHGHHHQVNSNNGTWHIDVGGDVRLGSVTYAYIDGTCQGWLPRGEVIVDVARGFEYEPVRKRVTIEPGQRELTLNLNRWTDMRAKGWYSGDTHVHFLSAQGAHTEQQGEDLNVVNLLQSQWGALFTNTEEFTGRSHGGGDYLTYVTQENRQHMLGHLTLLGLKSSVAPWCTDGPSEAEMGASLEATMSDWADQCHEQGGWVVIPHLPNPNGEPAALIATGRADAIEMLVHGEYQHLEYYRFLNGGYRLPLVGGTDKMTSDVPVGIYRTYANLGDQPFTYENWCKAMTAGRTFLSGGPMLSFSVEGAEIGDTVRLNGDGTVSLSAVAESIFPMHTLQIVQNGRIVAAVESAQGARRLELSERVKIEGDSWLAARVGGPEYGTVKHRDGWGRGIFAHTSPIYVATSQDWEMFSEPTARYMLTLIDGCQSYIDHSAPYYAPGSVTHHHGEDDHIAWLKRPFAEAREAVEKRLARYGLL